MCKTNESDEIITLKKEFTEFKNNTEKVQNEFINKINHLKKITNLLYEFISQSQNK